MLRPDLWGHKNQRISQAEVVQADRSSVVLQFKMIAHREKEAVKVS